MMKNIITTLPGRKAQTYLPNSRYSTIVAPNGYRMCLRNVELTQKSAKKQHLKKRTPIFCGSRKCSHFINYDVTRHKDVKYLSVNFPSTHTVSILRSNVSSDANILRAKLEFAEKCHLLNAWIFNSMKLSRAYLIHLIWLTE